MKDPFKTKSTMRGMEVSVYHDTGSSMELIATFVDEATYMLCKDVLEKDAMSGPCCIFYGGVV